MAILLEYASASVALVVVTAFISVAQSQSLDLQEMCASQARKTFQETESDYKNQPSLVEGTIVSNAYQSHYNTRLDRCLMELDRVKLVGSEFWTTSELIDAAERREYAFYTERGSEVVSCVFVPRVREMTYCTSHEQFDAVVAEYMEK